MLFSATKLLLVEGIIRMQFSAKLGMWGERFPIIRFSLDMQMLQSFKSRVIRFLTESWEIKLQN